MVNELTKLDFFIYFQFVCGILAMLFNWPILWVTIKYRDFQKSCGYLLAALALCDIVYGFGAVTNFFSMLFGWRVSLMTCFFIESKTPFSIICSYYFMFFLSIDRLIAVCAPLWYNKLADKGAWKYVAVVCILIVSYSLFQMYFMFLVAAGNPDKKVICWPGDFFQGFAATFTFTNYLVVTVVTLIIYLIVSIVIKVKKFDGPQNDRNSIFKTLFILMLVSAGCSLLAIILGFVLPQLAIDEDTKLFLLRIFQQYSRIYSVLDGPILYYCSSKYRRVFIAEFKVLRWLHKLCSSTTTTTVAGGGGGSATIIPVVTFQNSKNIVNTRANNNRPAAVVLGREQAHLNKNFIAQSNS